MEAIKQWILNIATVAVLMIVLDLILPEGKIRKFTQLLSGFIVMLVIINPIISLLGKESALSLKVWEDQVVLLNRQRERTTQLFQEEQRIQTLELYREMLLSDIRVRLEGHKKVKRAEVDMVLNENMDSENFGAIRRLYINLIFSVSERNQNELEQNKISEEIKREIQQVFLLDENDIFINISEE